MTDASPDYSDMSSMLRSITGKWQTPEEKCWALFYWTHMARRQTAPMMLHGLALTDPIRQFNDYGYTMCSTVSGINCSVWDALGLKCRYWDISLHTVPEVEYGGRWHMYDNSMSALYTLCDGKTLAGVEEIGRTGACAASGGKSEPGHIARYHCLMGTSANGFLTGADSIRSLEEESRCFNPKGLKLRTYFYDWDRGHRYILNLRDNESYTRYYHSLGAEASFFVPNNGKDPEKVNPRYHIRGNGVKVSKPRFDSPDALNSAYSCSNVSVSAGAIVPAIQGRPGEVVFKLDAGNVITALKMRGKFFRQSAKDVNQVFISTVNGMAWTRVWENEAAGASSVELKWAEQVNGAYEVLVKVVLLGTSDASHARLDGVEFEITTMLNSKTQPALATGKNTIYIGAGPQTDSIVFWPDLRGDNWRPYAVSAQNIATEKGHPGYMGVMHAAKPGEEASVVFRVDAPRDITQIEYGGRFYNRAPGARITLQHSFDNGNTWRTSYCLTNTAQPWDVLHYEKSTDISRGARSVLFKYVLNARSAGPDACSLYAVRMEVNHQATAAFRPLEVTFNWSEPQADYALRERSHTEVITSLPHRYTINAGGADRPIVNWMRVGPTNDSQTCGYSDGKNEPCEKHVPRWVTYGRNLAIGKPYTASVPSGSQWGAGDPEGKKLTDGIVGPPYPGGTAPGSALCWDKGQNPEVTVDLGQPSKCAAFRIQLGAGWPWWDALKGQVKDKIEVLTSEDGQAYQSQGFFNLNLRWNDLPANHFWPDDEVMAAHLFELVPIKPVTARYVRYLITPARILTVSEVQVLDSIRYEPFDLRVALPDDRL